MENWERKFEVSPEGVAKEVELSEEEKRRALIEMHPKKPKILRLKQEKRKFVADEKGTITIEKTDKEK